MWDAARASRVRSHSGSWFIAFGTGLMLLCAATCAAAAAQAQRSEPPENGAQINEGFRSLFDAVLNATRATFWNRQRMQEVNWEARAEEARADVIGAASLPEVARRINVLLDLLATSHTSLFTPDDVFYYLQKDVFWGNGAHAGIGLFSVRVEDRDFIDAILEGSTADRAGLMVGDEIVSVDGAPYHPIHSFRGKEGRTADLEFRRRREGPSETVRVRVESIAPVEAFAAATRASARVIERDGRRLGYVHVWSMLGVSETALAQVLPRFGIRPWNDKVQRLTPVAVDGLIVDMRGKVGGYAPVATRTLELIDPRGPDMTYAGNAGAVAWASVRGRNALLIDHHTRSAGELFAHAYKRERQGPAFGTRTAGAVTAGSLQPVPLDCLLYLGSAGLMVDGEVLEGPGVAPDVEVRRPIPYAAGADPVLEAAIDWLARNVTARGGSVVPRVPAN